VSEVQTALVTGAGSGVGRAVVLRLARLGWRVALVGRRVEALGETETLAGHAAGQLLSFPADITDAAAVARIASEVVERWGRVDALVNAAGTNVPVRQLETLSLDDYHLMMGTNLNGAYYCAQAVLPYMRAAGAGTIVNIISDAGKIASAKSGPGYVMSKFGLAGLSQSINAEERSRGIRACAIFPGDIDTPLLDRRPQPPSAEARARMMQADDVADCVVFCLTLPARVIVEEMLVRPA
jgi:NADP-dependent 3-hydroxy acid dehydrogenase YdfG